MRSKNGGRDQDMSFTILGYVQLKMYVFIALSYYAASMRLSAMSCCVLCMACSTLAAAPAKLLHLMKKLNAALGKGKRCRLFVKQPLAIMNRHTSNFVISDTLSQCRVDRPFKVLKQKFHV